MVISLYINDNIYQFLLKIDGKKGQKKVGFRHRIMSSDRSSAAGGGSAAGRRSSWTLSETSGLSNMTFLFGSLFFGFIVNFDADGRYTSLYIIELIMSGWCSMIDSKLVESRTSKTILSFDIPGHVTDMFQHPTNPNWLIVVSFTSVIVFEFDEDKNSLRQICELKASDNGFEYINSAHMSRNGQTLVLHTDNQVRETIRTYSRVLVNGIKSHSVLFFTMSSSGSELRLSQVSSYTHPTIESVEDNCSIGPMPCTSISQDGRFLFVVFRSNIIVLDVTTGSQVCVHDFDAFESLSCMTVVSQRNAHFLVLLSRERIITVFKYNSDLAVLEFRSRYEIPNNATSFSEDMSTYKCIEASSHASMQFFVAGSKSSDNGVIRLYMLSSNGEIQIISEQTTSLSVSEITSNKRVTCCLSKFSSKDDAYLHGIGRQDTVHPCHMILDESNVKPSLLQSTLNGAQIGLPPNSVHVLLPDGKLFSSNAENGLTIFGLDDKSVASTDPKDAHKSPITGIFPLEVDGKTFLVSFSDGIIKIWSIQKRGETVRLQIVATVSTEVLVQKKGVKFLALNGQTLLIVTNANELLRFRVEITGGIRAKIPPIHGPVVQIPSGQICQGISAVSPTHALIYVTTSEVRGCSLVIVSFSEGAAEVFKPIGTRETGKSPAVLTRDFAISAVDPITVCSTALSDDGESCSFKPKYIKDGKLCEATILAIVPCEGGFICIMANGFLFQFVYDAQQKPVFKKRIAVLECALTPKCRLQVSGNTVMVCQPRDDSSVELLTFRF